jgi:hypothetical protein
MCTHLLVSVPSNPGESIPKSMYVSGRALVAHLG